MNQQLPIHLNVNVHQQHEQIDPQSQELIKAIKENTRVLKDLKKLMKRNLNDHPFTIQKVSKSL
ncbi:hypothetical protein ACFPMF_01885 [Larkinella bovis]|uniref:Uncharacterized protein n=1 Tax=Larkinella bovis TaxID=683041 RepID=A0ABW0I7E5_9BACT